MRLLNLILFKKRAIVSKSNTSFSFKMHLAFRPTNTHPREKVFTRTLKNFHLENSDQDASRNILPDGENKSLKSTSNLCSSEGSARKSLRMSIFGGKPYLNNTL